MSLDRCDSISSHRCWNGSLAGATGGPYGTSIDLHSSLCSDWPEISQANKSWWLMCANSEQTFSQTDQYYPRCSWKTGWACIIRQTPSCLFTRAKTTEYSGFPWHVCQWPQPWPRGPPCIGSASGVEASWVVVAFFTIKSFCVCFALASSDYMIPIELVNAFSLRIWNISTIKEGLGNRIEGQALHGGALGSIPSISITKSWRWELKATPTTTHPAKHS